MYRVQFRTSGAGVIEQLADASAGIESIELDNAFYVDDGVWVESYTVSTTVEFHPRATVETLPGVTFLDSREVPTGPSSMTIHRLLVTAREPYPFILGAVLRQGAIPNRIVFHEREFDVVVTVQNWESIQALADEMTERFGTFDLDSVGEVEYTGEPLGSGTLSEVLVTKLTDEQLEVLETAYEMGFFVVPREASADDIAAELGIAASTLSERLRTAQENLLSLVFGRRDRDVVTDSGPR